MWIDIDNKRLMTISEISRNEAHLLKKAVKIILPTMTESEQARFSILITSVSLFFPENEKPETIEQVK